MMMFLLFLLLLLLLLWLLLLVSSVLAGAMPALPAGMHVSFELACDGPAFFLQGACSSPLVSSTTMAKVHLSC